MRQREPRLFDPGFLVFLRNKPCCLCGKPPKSEAAHIRMGELYYNKSPTGMQEKPDDKWATPMCAYHHRFQHTMSEEKFWYLNSNDPFAIAIKLYAEYGGDGGKPCKPRAIKPRLPKEKRAKIRSKGFAK